MGDGVQQQQQQPQNADNEQAGTTDNDGVASPTRRRLRVVSFREGQQLLRPALGDAPPPYEWRPDVDPDIVWVPAHTPPAAGRVALDAYGDRSLVEAMTPVTRSGRFGYRVQPALLCPDWRASWLQYRPRRGGDAETFELFDPQQIVRRVGTTAVVLYCPELQPEGESGLPILPPGHAEWDLPIFAPSVQLSAQPVVPTEHAAGATYDPRSEYGDPVGDLAEIVERPFLHSTLLDRRPDEEVVVRIDAHGPWAHLASPRMTHLRDSGRAIRPNELQATELLDIPTERRLWLEPRPLGIRAPETSEKSRLPWDPVQPERLQLERLRGLMGETASPTVVLDPSGPDQVVEGRGMTLLSGASALFGHLSAGRIEVYLWDGRGRLIRSDVQTAAAMMQRTASRGVRGLPLSSPGLQLGGAPAQELDLGDGFPFLQQPTDPMSLLLRQLPGRAEQPKMDSFRVLTIAQLIHLVRRDHTQTLLGKTELGAPDRARLAGLVSDDRFVLGTDQDGRNVVDTGIRGDAPLDPLAEAPAEVATVAELRNALAGLRRSADALEREPALSAHRRLLAPLRARLTQHAGQITEQNAARYQQLVNTAEPILTQSADRIRTARALDQRWGRRTTEQVSVRRRVALVNLHNRLGDPGEKFEQLESRYALAMAFADQSATAKGLFDRAETDLLAYQRAISEAPPDGYQQDLISSMTTLTSLRFQAHRDSMISDELFQAWQTLSVDMIQLEPQIRAGDVNTGLRARAAEHAQAFFEALDGATPDEVMPGAGGHSSTTHMANEYSHKGTTIGPFLHNEYGDGPAFSGRIRNGQWPAALRSWNRLQSGLDAWIAKRYEQTRGATDPNAVQARYHGAMRRELEEIAAHEPTRVWAVFEPDRERYGDARDFFGMPLQLYYWKQGDEWILRDLTNPERTFEDNVDASPGETEPPHALFQELDTKLHFPKGSIAYQIPGGRSATVETTESMSFADWCQWIGLGLAAAGIILATAGAGAVAVPMLVAGSLVTAAGATADMIERADHGALDATTALLDVATIVGSLASAGALSAGRIVASSANALRGGTALTGNAARIAAFANRVYVPLVGAAVTADGVGLVTMTASAASQIDAIKNGPGTPEDKERAIGLLVTQLAIMGGLTLLSVKGDLPSLTGGRPNLVLDVIDGVPTVRPAGSGPTRVGQTQTLAEAFEGARQPGVRGQIDADNAARVMSGLPELRIDPDHVTRGITDHLSRELGVDPTTLRVERLGGAEAGFSGAAVYRVHHAGAELGFFKVFGNRAEMLREVGAIQRLRELDTPHLRPVELGNPSRVGDRGSVLMEGAPGRIVARGVRDVGALPAGAARTAALDGLTQDVRAVARAMAELHAAGDAGRRVATEVLETQIRFLNRRWEGLRGHLGPADRVRLQRAMEGMFERFRTADLPATIAHGDGHGGNFAVRGDQVTTFDVETLYRSVGPDGAGTAPGATDVGRFAEWISFEGVKRGLTGAEMDGLRDAFLREYRSLAGDAARGADFGSAVRFYEINLNTIALNSEIRAAGDAWDAAASPTLARLKRLLGQ